MRQVVMVCAFCTEDEGADGRERGGGLGVACACSNCVLVWEGINNRGPTFCASLGLRPQYRIEVWRERLTETKKLELDK